MPGFRATPASFLGTWLTPREDQSANKFAGVDTIACDAELNFHASIFIQNTTPVCNLQQVSHSIFQVILTTLSPAIIFSTDRAFAHVQMHSECFRKYGADRNGCAHVCGIGYALTITVTCEHTEQLTLVESDPE